MILGFVLILALVLLGGASRADALTQPFLRIVCVALGCIALVSLTRSELSRVKIPLTFVALYCLLCLIQLVPLPPGLWLALPGRPDLAAVLPGTGVDIGWRPWSLSPDRTLNALLAALPALCTLLVLATLPRGYLARIPYVLVFAAILCVILGLSQIYTGAPYPYRHTNTGNAVGFFANRNHAALLLAMGFPLIAQLVANAHDSANFRRSAMLGAFAALAFAALLLVNGSRAGMLTGAVGLFGAFVILTRFGARAMDRKWSLVGIVAGGAVLAGLVGVFWMSGRGLTVDRFATTNDDAELRLTALPTIIEMILTYFPAGAGVGTFETAFKIFEPDAMIAPVYLNHAHNDYLELIADAGIAGVALLVGFLWWLGRRMLAMWQRRRELSSEAVMAAVLLLQIGIASLFDYPIRVPFISATLVYLVAQVAGATTWQSRPVPMADPREVRERQVIEK